jgi:hypothetical protein
MSENRWLEPQKISTLDKVHKSLVVPVQLQTMNNVFVTKM